VQYAGLKSARQFSHRLSKNGEVPMACSLAVRVARSAYGRLDGWVGVWGALEGAEQKLLNDSDRYDRCSVAKPTQRPIHPPVIVVVSLVSPKRTFGSVPHARRRRTFVCSSIPSSYEESMEQPALRVYYEPDDGER
jgi:hypothetical protein